MGAWTAESQVSSIEKIITGGKVTIITSVPAFSSSFPFQEINPVPPGWTTQGEGCRSWSCRWITRSLAVRSFRDQISTNRFSLRNTSNNYCFSRWQQLLQHRPKIYGLNFEERVGLWVLSTCWWKRFQTSSGRAPPSDVCWCCRHVSLIRCDLFVHS